MNNTPIGYDRIDVMVAPFQFSVRGAKGQTVKFVSFTCTRIMKFVWFIIK